MPRKRHRSGKHENSNLPTEACHASSVDGIHMREHVMFMWQNPFSHTVIQLVMVTYSPNGSYLAIVVLAGVAVGVLIEQ